MAAISPTYLTIKNRTDYEIYVKFTPEDRGKAPKSMTLLPDTEETYLLESGKYWVYASGREVEFTDGGARKETNFYPCFGVFDSVEWDEKQAVRLYDLPNGKRNLTFNNESCVDLDSTTRAIWKNLDRVTVKIFKPVFQYIY